MQFCKTEGSKRPIVWQQQIHNAASAQAGEWRVLAGNAQTRKIHPLSPASWAETCNVRDLHRFIISLCTEINTKLRASENLMPIQTKIKNRKAKRALTHWKSSVWGFSARLAGQREHLFAHRSSPLKAAAAKLHIASHLHRPEGNHTERRNRALPARPGQPVLFPVTELSGVDTCLLNAYIDCFPVCRR